MVIKTVVKPKGVKLPSKRPFGSIVDFGREVLKTYGFYQEYNLQRYDPQVYVDKYTYKPHKRLTGYAGKILHKKKIQRSSSRGYEYQEHGKFPRFNFRYAKFKQYSQSGYRSKSYSQYRRKSWLPYQSNMVIT